MGAQLNAAATQIDAALANPQLPAEQRAAYQARLGQIQTEAVALQNIQTGLATYSTVGSDNFHRSNDVFGLGLEIDF